MDIYIVLAVYFLGRAIEAFESKCPIAGGAFLFSVLVTFVIWGASSKVAQGIQ